MLIKTQGGKLLQEHSLAFEQEKGGKNVYNGGFI